MGPAVQGTRAAHVGICLLLSESLPPATWCSLLLQPPASKMWPATGPSFLWELQRRSTGQPMRHCGLLEASTGAGRILEEGTKVILHG